MPPQQPQLRVDSHSMDEEMEDSLSPRRSPQQASRVKRSHRFPTDFRGVRIQVLEGSNFMHPRPTVPVTKPAVHLIMGNDAYRGQPGAQRQAGNTWDFNAQCDLPYRGQPRLRFLLVDLAGPRPVQIGFKDVNVLNEEFREKPWEAQLTLLGRHGPCGTLHVAVNMTKELIDVPQVIQMPQLSTGLSPMPGDHEVSFAQSIDSDDDVAFATRSGISAPHRSVQIHLHRLDGVPVGAKPYVLGTVGKEKVRSGTHSEQGDRIQFDETMIFPYKGTRYLKLSVKDNKKMQTDPKLGTVTVDLDRYLNSDEPTKVMLPIAGKGEQRGNILATIAWSGHDEQEGRLISHMETPSTDSSSLSSCNVPAENLRNVRALRVHVVELDEMDIKDPLNIYIKGKLGREQLRTQTLSDVASAKCPVEHGFVWPFEGERYVKFTAKNDAVRRHDRRLGAGVLDVEPIFGSPTVGVQETSCTLKDRHGVTFGILRLVVEPVRDVSVDRPFTELTSQAPMSSTGENWDVKTVVADLISLEAEHDGAFGRAFDTPDPYVVCQFGPEKVTGKVYKKAGFTCEMDDRFEFSTKDEHSHYYNLKFDVFDKNILKDSVLGTGVLNVPRDPVAQRPFKVKLINTRGQARGYLNLQLTTSASEGSLTPAVQSKDLIATPRAVHELEGGLKVPSEIRATHGSISVEVIKLTDLVNPRPKMDRLDPYAVVSFHQDKLRGSVAKDGGENVAMGDIYHFPYQPLKYMKIEAYDQAHLSKDPLLGSSLITLDKFVSKGTQKLKVPLVAKDGSAPAGMARIILKFHPESVSKAYVEKGTPSKLAEAEATVSTTSESSSDQEVAFRHKAFHVTGLMLSLDKEDETPVSPFIQTKYGHSKLKGVPMDHPMKNTEWKRGVAYPEIYSYSTKDKSTCTFDVRDDRKFRLDKSLGTASINVHELEDQVPAGAARQFIAVVKDKKGHAVGELRGSLSFDNAEVPKGASVSQPLGEESESTESDLGRMARSQVSTDAKRVAITVRHVEGLPPRPDGTLLPYAVAKFGRTKLRGQHGDQKGRSVCPLGDVMHYPYQPFKQVHFKVKDNQRLHIDPVIGEGSLSIDECINKTGVSEVIVPLQRNNAPVGKLYLSVIANDNPIEKAYVVSNAFTSNAAPVARSVSSISSTSNEEDVSAVTTKNRSYKLELLDCEGLPTPGGDETIAPYVVGEFAKTKLRTETAYSSGGKCVLGDVLYVPYKPVKSFVATVKDNRKHKVDPTIASGQLNVDAVINGPVNNPVQVILHTNDGVPAGKINARFTPLTGELKKGYIESPKRERAQDSSTESEPEGLSTVKANYPAFNVELLGCDAVPVLPGATIDPYIVGRYKKDKLRTATVDNQHSSFHLGDVMHFAWQNYRPLELKLYDNKKMAIDKLLGTGQIDVEQLINGAPAALRVPLTDKRGDDAGHVNVRFAPSTASVEKAYVTHPEKRALVPDVQEDSSSDSSQTAENVGFQHKAFHISNLKLLGVDSAVLAGKDFAPFIKTKYGHRKLRGATLEHGVDQATFHEKHSYTLNKHSNVRIQVTNNRHAAVDKKLGSAVVDLHQLESAGKLNSIFVAPVVNKSGQRVAEVTGNVSFGNDIVPKDHQLTPYGIAVHYDESSTSEEESAKSGYASQVKTKRPGFSLELLRCEHLLGAATMSPFVVGRFGKVKLRSATAENAGASPAFGDVMFFPYKPVRFMDFEVRDNRKHKKDASLGSGQLDIDYYINGGAAEIAVPLSLKENKQQTGRMLLRFTPMSSPIAKAYVISPRAPAPQTVAVAQKSSPAAEGSAIHIKNPTLSQLNTAHIAEELKPYLISKYDGKKLRGNTATKEPYEFQELHAYRLSEKPHVQVAVYNNRKLANDKLVGVATIPVPSAPGSRSFSTPVIEKGSTRQVAVMSGTLVVDNADVPKGHHLTDLSPLTRNQIKEAVSSESSVSDHPSKVTTSNKAFTVECVRCEGLPTDPKQGTSNPYMISRFGKSKLRTQTIPEGGSNPEFGDIMHFPYSPVKPLSVKVKDNRPLHIDSTIGRGTVDVDAVINARSPIDLRVPLRGNDGASAGHAVLRFTPQSEPIKKAYIVTLAKEGRAIQAKDIEHSASSTDDERVPSHVQTDARSFILEILDGRDLERGRNAILQPFVEVKVGHTKLKTATVKNGGSNPRFEDQMYFPYESLRTVKFYAKDNCRMHRDPIVGVGSMSLDQYIAQPVSDVRVPLTVAASGGPAGFLNCRVRTSNNVVNKAYVLSPELPHAAPKEREIVPTATASESSVEEDTLKTTFTPPVPTQQVQIHVLSGKGLESDKISEHLSPYIVAKTGRAKLRTATVPKAASECDFGDTMYFPFKGYRYVKFVCRDNQRLATDPMVGEAILDLARTPTDSTVKLPLYNSFTGKNQGEVSVRVTTSPTELKKAHVVTAKHAVPASDSSSDSSEAEPTTKKMMLKELDHGVPQRGLKVEVVEATSLPKSQKADILRTFVRLQVGKKKLQGHTDQSGQPTIRFNDEFFFPYKDQRYLKVDVAEDLKMRRDPTLGSTLVDLQPLLPKGGDLRVSVGGQTHVVMRVTPLDEPIHKANVVSPDKKALREIAPPEASSSDESEDLIDDLKIRSSQGTSNGSFQVEVVKANKLPTTSARVLQPYVIARNAKSKVKTTTIKDGGWDPEFGPQTCVFPWDGFRYLQLTAKDNQRLRRDPEVASGLVDLDPIMASRTAREMAVPLHTASGHDGGELHIRVTPCAETIPKAYLMKPRASKKAGDDSSSDSSAELESNVVHPHKSFRLHIVRGKELAASPKNNVLQPFVIAKFGRDKLRSHTVVNGGPAAVFGSEMVFPCQKLKTLHFKVKDNVRMARDPVTGVGRLDLDRYIVNSAPTDIEVPLVDAQTNAAAGSLTVRLEPSLDTVEKAYVVDPSDDSSDGMDPSDLSVQCEAVAVELIGAPGGSLVGKFGKAELKTQVAPRTDEFPFKLEETFVWPYKPYKNLHLKVYERIPLARDPLIGTSKINLDKLLADPTKTTHSLKLLVTSKSGESAETMKVRVHVLNFPVHEPHVLRTAVFQNHLCRSVEVHVLEARGLKNRHRASGRLTPYLSMNWGANRATTALLPAGDAQINQRLIFPKIPNQPLAFEGMDVLDPKEHTPFGAGYLDVNPFFQTAETEGEFEVPLKDGGASAGLVILKLVKSQEAVEKPAMLSAHQMYQPAGRSVAGSATDGKLSYSPKWRSMQIHVHQLKDLKNVEIIGKMDPYVKVNLGNIEIKSDVYHNAGTDVDINLIFEMPYTQHEDRLTFTVLDEERWRKDKQSGIAVLNLEPIATDGPGASKSVPIDVLLHYDATGKTAGRLLGTVVFAEREVTDPITMTIRKGVVN